MNVFFRANEDQGVGCGRVFFAWAVAVVDLELDPFV